MTKWADYCISEVHYNSDHSRIISCKVHPDLGDDLGVSSVQIKQQIVNNLLNRVTYITTIKKDGAYIKGDNVICYLVNNEYFIRTDGNKTTSDNLGELPEY